MAAQGYILEFIRRQILKQIGRSAANRVGRGELNYPERYLDDISREFGIDYDHARELFHQNEDYWANRNESPTDQRLAPPHEIKRQIQDYQNWEPGMFGLDDPVQPKVNAHRATPTRVGAPSGRADVRRRRAIEKLIADNSPEYWRDEGVQAEYRALLSENRKTRKPKTSF